MQNASNFIPAPNSCLKWSQFANIVSYLMIFFIFKKILLHQSDFGWILVILAVLGYFEAKKCAKCLKFLPSLKFMSPMEPSRGRAVPSFPPLPLFSPPLPPSLPSSSSLLSPGRGKSWLGPGLDREAFGFYAACDFVFSPFLRLFTVFHTK